MVGAGDFLFPEVAAAVFVHGLHPVDQFVVFLLGDAQQDFDDRYGDVHALFVLGEHLHLIEEPGQAEVYLLCSSLPEAGQMPVTFQKIQVCLGDFPGFLNIFRKVVKAGWSIAMRKISSPVRIARHGRKAEVQLIDLKPVESLLRGRANKLWQRQPLQLPRSCTWQMNLIQKDCGGIRE